MGARLRRPTATQRSKKGSEKLLGRILGKGSQKCSEKVLGRVLGKGSQKCSEKGAFFYGFYTKKGFWGRVLRRGSEKGVSRRCPERSVEEYAPLGVRPIENP